MERVIAALLVALLGAVFVLVGVAADAQVAKALGGLAVIGGVLYAIAYLAHPAGWRAARKP